MNDFIYLINKKKHRGFKLLYDNLYHSLIYYGSRYCSDCDVVEDCVQDSILSLWEYDKEIISYPALVVFLQNNIKNRLINIYNHNKVKEKHIQYHKSAEIYHDDFWVNEIENEVFVLLSKEIDRLPKRTREVLLLKLEGKTNQEIMDLLEITLNTVNTQKRNAMIALRKKRSFFLRMIYLIIHI